MEKRNSSKPICKYMGNSAAATVYYMWLKGIKNGIIIIRNTKDNKGVRNDSG